MDNMLSELTPQQLVEWEAALCVLDLDRERWIAGKVCEVLHQVAERFNSSGNASTTLPTHEDFMDLVTFEPNRKQAIDIRVQSQDEIARTLTRLK